MAASQATPHPLYRMYRILVLLSVTTVVGFGDLCQVPHSSKGSKWSIRKMHISLCKERNAQASRGSQKVILSDPSASKGFVHSFEVAFVRHISVSCKIS